MKTMCCQNWLAMWTAGQRASTASQPSLGQAVCNRRPLKLPVLFEPERMWALCHIDSLMASFFHLFVFLAVICSELPHLNFMAWYCSFEKRPITNHRHERFLEDCSSVIVTKIGILKHHCTWLEVSSWMSCSSFSKIAASPWRLPWVVVSTSSGLNMPQWYTCFLRALSTEIQSSVTSPYQVWGS